MIRLLSVLGCVVALAVSAQSAPAATRVVTNNNDPDKIGFFLPEVGDEVLFHGVARRAQRPLDRLVAASTH